MEAEKEVKFSSFKSILGLVLASVWGVCRCWSCSGVYLSVVILIGGGLLGFGGFSRSGGGDGTKDKGKNSSSLHMKSCLWR